MKLLRIALLIAHGFAVSRLAGSASVDSYESAKPAQTAVIDLLHALNDMNSVEDNGDVEYGNEDEYYYDEEDEEDYLSGDYGLELPRVAFSTKPKDPSVVLTTERKRKGKGKKKGKGRKRNPCLRKYKDFCINGVCQYLKDLHAPSCICLAGFSGERCHLFSLPVSKEEGGYNRTTALAVVAVVLSLICLTIIGILLALRKGSRTEGLNPLLFQVPQTR
ncbi:hypothetical protein ANANG_G00160180 [Anguilla anguilla]|uniref:Proheparin-binding EGF-like growth factor n=1 Tax=Anguilla anguilla TaxID=7936 RepID=A0A9D3M839_ANGAN|nr:hypothetical protein ANANG_G00160180 [Anguilla anguilla]